MVRSHDLDNPDNDDGARRLLGMPIGLPWDTSPNVTLRCFEPENPALLVPRTVGIGWGVNLGAVAVRLGVIRPDDSLPDLEEHIPPRARRVLVAAPWMGAAATCAAAARVAGARRVATRWTLGGRPKRYASGPVVAAAAASLAVGSAVFPVVMGAAGRDAPDAAGRPAPASSPGVDVAAGAQALGLQSMTFLSLLAARREARDRGSRQPLAIAAPLLVPLVSGGVVVATVRSALSALGRALASERIDGHPAGQPAPNGSPSGQPMNGDPRDERN